MSNLTTLFTDIADAIREKKGTTDSIVAETFPDEIASIEAGSTINNQDKTIRANGTYTADSGYTGLGTVTVNVPTSGGEVVPVEGAKVFTSVEEMNDTAGNEGDLAVVYENALEELVVGETYESIQCPQTIIFDTARTGTTNIWLATGTSTMSCNQWVRVTATAIQFYKKSGFSGVALNTLKYTSTDGITYTRTDNLGETVTIAEIYNNAYTTITVQSANIDLLQQMFIVRKRQYFGGVFIFVKDSWAIAPNQLDVSSDYVYEKDFYGSNGFETGTLQVNENLTLEEVMFKTNLWNTLSKLKLNETVTDFSFKNYTGTNIPYIDTSNITNMYYAFDECEALTTIPLLNTSSVTNMERMFGKCSALTEIPLLDTSSVTTMKSMFYNCKSLTAIPLLDTSKVTNMNGMFSSCTALTTIPLLNTSSVTDTQYMFIYCSALTEIPLLDTSNVTTMESMFDGCHALTTVPVLNTSKVTNIRNVFSDCPALSDESLNNILAMCTNATNVTNIKALSVVGLSEEQATKCATLSNYSAFTAAGWTTGY